MVIVSHRSCNWELTLTVFPEACSSQVQVYSQLSHLVYVNYDLGIMNKYTSLTIVASSFRVEQIILSLNNVGDLNP